MGIEVSGNAQRVLQALIAVIAVVACLAFGREILIPLAMAILLTFLLGPVVSYLERRHLPRAVAVLLVMASIAAAAGTATWVIGVQFRQLAEELPSYRQNLRERISSLRVGGRALTNVQQTIEQVGQAAEEHVGPMGNELIEDPPPVQPVRVVPDEAVPVDRLVLFTSTVLAPLANAAIIVVLVLFMLLNREDLRNRIVRLAGKRLTLTTRTLDEIGTRISRYLLASSIINGSFGIAVAAGLWFIGVHYALMWGFLAGALRFVPYVGPMMGAAMPITMAFIQFPGNDWQHLAMTVALFVVLELVTNNIAEPMLYGQSAGVSTVALLVSVTFWTWVWGPMGLVLAVPLTVVMAVLGDYVPALQPLGILLGDKPPLAPFVTYYQRLLANDVEEAASIVEEQQRTSSTREVFDKVLMPALVLAEKDFEREDLLPASQEFIWQVTRDFIDDLAPKPATEETANRTVDGPALRARVLGIPAHDLADVLALEMLQQEVPLKGGHLEVISSKLLIGEILGHMAKDMPDAVLISSLGPIGVRQTRGLCKRLRQAYPELKIIVGRWSYEGDRERMTQSLRRRGADQVVTSLAEAHDLLLRLHSPTSAVSGTSERAAPGAALLQSP